jgi:hypothetical protein
MSKQFYIYALPTDIERIVAKLKKEVDVGMISLASPRSEPIWLDSPIRDTSLLPSVKSTSVACCFVANGFADIRFRHHTGQSAWHETDESEVIIFTGCDFDGKNLVRGRFYFQTDSLVGPEIIRKRSEFLVWADRIFRLVKRSLQSSRALDAYIGPDALAWERSGGRFATLALPGHKLVFASREDDR